jgi:hypothetical protein
MVSGEGRKEEGEEGSVSIPSPFDLGAATPKGIARNIWPLADYPEITAAGSARCGRIEIAGHHVVNFRYVQGSFIETTKKAPRVELGVLCTEALHDNINMTYGFGERLPNIRVFGLVVSPLYTVQEALLSQCVYEGADYSREDGIVIGIEATWRDSLLPFAALVRKLRMWV